MVTCDVRLLERSAIPELRRHHEAAEQRTRGALTEPKLLSDWAGQGGLVDAAIDVTDDDLVAAIELPEAIYRTVTAAGSSPPTSTCSTSALPARSSPHDYCAPPSRCRPYQAAPSGCWVSDMLKSAKSERTVTGISKFGIGTANTPLLNGITAFVHTYGDWCLL